MAKRLVVCCDGTWNTPDQKDAAEDTCTNVTKLALAVAPKDPAGVEQRTFYDKGVGTGSVDHLRGGALGVGLSTKVEEAYMFVVQNFELGDEVFLFGFSRGAYTARSTAGFIRNSGLLLPRYECKLDEAYNLYRDRTNATHPRSVEARLFRKSYAQEIRIKCIGVWDTVGALGIPNLPTLPAISSHWKFHDVALSSYVDNAFQALAIDEQRKPFQPALWEQQPDSTGQTLEQVWFAGVHTNVGGGYRDSGLSDLALQWMMAKAAARGLAFASMDGLLKPNARGALRSSMTWYYALLGRSSRSVCEQRVDPSGRPMITNETVAPSAVARWLEDKSYRPENLRRYMDRSGLTAELPVC
jgi:uncharacterized protein (DUF2235 family)